jgi:hypothetical protein
MPSATTAAAMDAENDKESIGFRRKLRRDYRDLDKDARGACVPRRSPRPTRDPNFG